MFGDKPENYLLHQHFLDISHLQKLLFGDVEIEKYKVI